MPTFERDGITINYAVQGSGPPLLMIMGLAGTMHAWQYQLEDLSQHFTLIRLDNRGSGASSAPEDFTLYSMRHFADDAVAVLDQLNLDQAHVWGISLGGMIAQHVAMYHAERVDRLVLGCTMPGGECSTPPPMWVLELMMEGATKPAEQAMRDSVKFNFGPDFPGQHPEVIEQYVADGIRYRVPRQGFQGQWMAVSGHDTCRNLDQITLPTLVQHGDTDHLIPVENGQYLASHIPQAKLDLYPGAGHLYFIEQAAQVNRAVTNFLQQESI